MKSYSQKFVFCTVVAFGLALSATFTACGDSTTEVTETSGLDVLAKGEKLPDCTTDNAGDMFFVTDSAAVFYCADGEWATLNGKDGERGAVGDKGDGGVAGSSCSAKTVDEGIEVTCGNKVVGVLKNGKTGGNGKSCSAAQDEKTKNVVITCETDDGKGVTYTIENGAAGKSACALAKKNQEECTDAELTAWVASLNGRDGKSCSATQNEAKTVTTITCPDENGEYVDYVIKNGENCSTEKDGDGSYTIKCAGSDDVTIENGAAGKSAYEIAKDYGFAGTELEWLASMSLGIMKDSRDGQVYRTVTIGTQTWMAENLNYNTNTETVTNSWCANGSWSPDLTADPEKGCATFGRLYTWAAAVGKTEDECGYGKDCSMSGSVQGVCPTGWHLPSNEEWETLIKTVGAEYSDNLDVVGTKLKSTSGWDDNGDGDDSFGFAVLPAGYRSGYNEFFFHVGDIAYFWSSTKYESTTAYHWGFYSYVYGTKINGLPCDLKANEFKYNGNSVRCLRN